MTLTELSNDEGTRARIVADSVTVEGDRIVSFEIRFHRFVLAELNTHCVFARNSASSRAIPVEHQLRRYWEDPAYPLSWPAEQRGMQGGAELEGDDRVWAEALFEGVHATTYTEVRRYLSFLESRYGTEKDENGVPEWKKHALHKSVVNRLLEPMQWHTALVTASFYKNFFDQRVAPAAQPELRAVAAMMKDLFDEHEPTGVQRGQWHLPYLHDDEYTVASRSMGPRLFSKESTLRWPIDGYDAREVSSARCARLSYLTQNGVRDIEEDLRLYRNLVGQWHWSPLEHVATPWPQNSAMVPILDPDTRERIAMRRVPRLGKFPGWQQYRHVEEARQGYVSQR